jgi:hypothetical protein
MTVRDANALRAASLATPTDLESNAVHRKRPLGATAGSRSW